MKALFTCLPWHNPSPLIYILLSTSQFTSIINASWYHVPHTSFLMLFSPTVCLRKLLIVQIWESNTSCSVLFNQVQREASKLAKMLSSHQHRQRCLPLRNSSATQVGNTPPEQTAALHARTNRWRFYRCNRSEINKTK